MKSILIIIIINLSLLLCVSCENKHNCNGNLDGNWQLTLMTDISEGSVFATKDDCIYYAISLDLIKIWKTRQEYKYYLSEFEVRGDSLFLTKVCVSPYDSIVSPKDIYSYGVSEDGAFKICRNTSAELILSNKDKKLWFRKQ